MRRSNGCDGIPVGGPSRCFTASSRAVAGLKIASSEPLTVYKLAWPSIWSWLGASTISPASDAPRRMCLARLCSTDQDQWRAVLVFKTRKPPPDQPPTLAQMNLIVAQLGGFLG